MTESLTNIRGRSAAPASTCDDETVPARFRSTVATVGVGVGVGVTLMGVGLVLWAWAASDDREVDRTEVTEETIVMLGDSITEEGPWSTNFSDPPVANRGYSGYTTAQLVDVARGVAEARPSAVYILTGTNDIRDDRPPSWTVQHLGTILDEFERTSPDTVVTVQTILPRADRRADVVAANLAIVEIARSRGFDVLDLHRVFDDGNGALRPVDTRDGIHLSQAGNLRWADVLRSEFAQL